MNEDEEPQKSKRQKKSQSLSEVNSYEADIPEVKLQTPIAKAPQVLAEQIEYQLITCNDAILLSLSRIPCIRAVQVPFIQLIVQSKLFQIRNEYRMLYDALHILNLLVI